MISKAWLICYGIITVFKWRQRCGSPSGCPCAETAAGSLPTNQHKPPFPLGQLLELLRITEGKMACFTYNLYTDPLKHT